MRMEVLAEATVNSVTVDLTTLECFVKHVAKSVRMEALLTVVTALACVWMDSLEITVGQVLLDPGCRLLCMSAPKIVIGGMKNKSSMPDLDLEKHWLAWQLLLMLHTPLQPL